MCAGAEREVRVGAAADVEGVGIGEGAAVAVGASRKDHALLARGQVIPADLHMAAGAAQHDADGRHQAEHLFDRARHEVEIVSQPGQLFGVLDEQQQAAGNQARSGDVAGVDEALSGDKSKITTGSV